MNQVQVVQCQLFFLGGGEALAEVFNLNLLHTLCSCLQKIYVHIVHVLHLLSAKITVAWPLELYTALEIFLNFLYAFCFLFHYLPAILIRVFNLLIIVCKSLISPSVRFWKIEASLSQSIHTSIWHEIPRFFPWAVSLSWGFSSRTFVYTFPPTTLSALWLYLLLHIAL